MNDISGGAGGTAAGRRAFRALHTFHGRPLDKAHRYVYAQAVSTQASNRGHIFLGNAPVHGWDESDSQLMRRVASRDESALALLYDRYSGNIYSLLRRILRDESVAEEILQDVFLHLWRIAANFEPERGELRSWLLVISRNRAISFLRQVQKNEVADVDFTAVSSAVPQDTAAAHNEFVTRIRGILAQLPAEQGQLFEMAYFDGMTHAEIAENTGQPLGTVKTRLRSTLTSLRRAFGQ